MTVRGFNELDFSAVCSIYIEAKHDELQFENRNFEITPLEEDAVILAASKSRLYWFLRKKKSWVLQLYMTISCAPCSFEEMLAEKA